MKKIFITPEVEYIELSAASVMSATTMSTENMSYGSIAAGNSGLSIVNTYQATETDQYKMWKSRN